MKWFYFIFAQLGPGDIDIPQVVPDGNTVKTVLQIVFGIFGAIALVMITLGGFKFTISRGDPNAVKSARETIIYALIGLFVAMSAFAIVTYVVGRI